MEPLLDVVSVVPQQDYMLLLTFDNNEQRLFDMRSCLEKKPFLKLKSLPFFMTARVEEGTVVWPGNIDIDPETLWHCSRVVQS